MTGEANIVDFHNEVYGCSGVMPDKYPCEGPTFRYICRCTWPMQSFIPYTVSVSSYYDFAPLFKAEMFDPDKWADIFKKSGAKCTLLSQEPAPFPSKAFDGVFVVCCLGGGADLVG